jgi:hypothetical protein
MGGKPGVGIESVAFEFVGQRLEDDPSLPILLVGERQGVGDVLRDVL